jgi:hypothetical protein
MEAEDQEVNGPMRNGAVANVAPVKTAEVEETRRA